MYYGGLYFCSGLFGFLMKQKWFKSCLSQVFRFESISQKLEFTIKTTPLLRPLFLGTNGGINSEVSLYLPYA